MIQTHAKIVGRGEVWMRTRRYRCRHHTCTITRCPSLKKQLMHCNGNRTAVSNRKTVLDDCGKRCRQLPRHFSAPKKEISECKNEDQLTKTHLMELAGTEVDPQKRQNFDRRQCTCQVSQPWNQSPCTWNTKSCRMIAEPFVHHASP